MSGKNILLGLGLGMVCSGILLGLFNRRGSEISDAEIKRRAAELGMVEDNRDVILTSELKDTDTDKKEENSDLQEEEASDKEESANQNQELLENNEKDENTEEETNTVKTQTTQSEKQEEQTEKTQTKKKKKISSSIKDNSNAEKKDSNDNKNNTEESITIEIATGMTAGEICEKLKEQGIIKNAVKFRNYISKKKMQRNLRAGTYQINKNAGYDEILEIICKG